MKKFKQEEDLEVLNEMGQESDKKGAKAVIEKFTEMEKDTQTEEDQKLETLTKKRKSPKIFSYKEQLSIYLAELLKSLEMPKKYVWQIDILDKGIGLKIWLPINRKELGQKDFAVQRRFKISGEVKYDYQMCINYAYWAEDQVLRHSTTDKQVNGIILPNGQLKTRNNQGSN